MRGTIAKQQRRRAEELTPRMPERRYDHSSPIRLAECTRAVYRKLKAGWKRGRHA